MHHHGVDGACHPGPGGLIYCPLCDINDAEDEEA